MHEIGLTKLIQAENNRARLAAQEMTSAIAAERGSTKRSMNRAERLPVLTRHSIRPLGNFTHDPPNTRLPAKWVNI